MTLEVEDVHWSGRVGGGFISELAVAVRACLDLDSPTTNKPTNTNHLILMQSPQWGP